MTEALQLWKKLAGKTDGAAESQNASQGILIDGSFPLLLLILFFLRLGSTLFYFFLVPSNSCSISM